MTALATEPVAADEAPTAGPTVIGLDTSLVATGIASSSGWCDTVGYTDKKNPITKLPHAQRLAALTRLKADITLMIGTPDLIVMELPAPSRAGGGGHERAWLWWELYRWISRHNIPLALVAPNQRALYATGKGTADKQKVIEQVTRRWPDWDTDGDDNRADAVALMAAGRDWYGHPVGTVPQANRSVLDRIDWPTREP